MKRAAKVFLGADHAGFEAKETLKNYLDTLKVTYEDLSPVKVEGDDYPDVSFDLGKKVTRTKGSRGILVCGSGEGVAIAANKVKGIRAVAVTDAELAKMSRLHNDSNVLGLSGWYLSSDTLKKIVSVWLKTPFSGEERHARRIRKISAYEGKR